MYLCRTPWVVSRRATGDDPTSGEDSDISPDEAEGHDIVVPLTVGVDSTGEEMKE
jgi:hypothetical protein